MGRDAGTSNTLEAISNVGEKSLEMVEMNLVPGASMHRGHY